VREPSPGHKIACHIEDADLAKMEPVITQVDKGQGASESAGQSSAAE
jgi:hypothetical protein